MDMLPGYGVEVDGRGPTYTIIYVVRRIMIQQYEYQQYEVVVYLSVFARHACIMCFFTEKQCYYYCLHTEYLVYTTCMCPVRAKKLRGCHLGCSSNVITELYMYVCYTNQYLPSLFTFCMCRASCQTPSR